ncbi:MAG: hypothetical protein AAFU78_10620, partial [Cyanobacteria bacterium J06633_2]
MTSPSQPLRSAQSSTRQSGLVGWLINLPNAFERWLPRGKDSLFLMVIAVLALSLPLIITPIEVWQQA